MIAIYKVSGGEQLNQVVYLSYVRSFTEAQVRLCDELDETAKIHVFINVSVDDVELIRRVTDKNVKIVLHGKICAEVASMLGVAISDLGTDALEWSACEDAPRYGFSESIARIRYVDLPDGIENGINDRPLVRYDFMKEWNNLGYGSVTTDGSIWSLACVARIHDSRCVTLADVYIGEETVSIYVSLSKVGDANVLWVNRSVGLVDTYEFRLIESYICNYQPQSGTCLPLLKETPYGYDGMVSMRLDCDEAIASSRELFEFYKSESIPFSLAIKTNQDINPDDVELVHDVLDAGGAILSHSVNHKPNWGDDYQDVQAEANVSAEGIRQFFGIDDVSYAVSPFHQNPDFAVDALNDSGYRGFVGGIICNDPQYLVARGGRVTVKKEIVTHSQQCMLHGDCMMRSVEDSIVIYKSAASNALGSGAVFGFLDHPFSARYQYGWHNEEQRRCAHQELIKYIKDNYNVKFVNENECLEFIVKKSKINLSLDNEKISVSSFDREDGFDIAIEYKGNTYSCHELTR